MSPTCTYAYDSAATKEYQAMSGCKSSIPIEQGAGAGSNCGHWAESCFLNEVMTTAANSDLPISRLTIAGLEDLGYQVNYDATTAKYAASNMDSSCLCSNRRSGAPIRRLSGPARQLSAEGQQIAIAYGQGIMAQNRQQNSLIPESEDAIDIGGDIVYVLYQEDDTVYSMIVTPFD
jgi:Leishmanolysin